LRRRSSTASASPQRLAPRTRERRRGSGKRGSAGADARLEQADDLARLRETPRLLLGEDQLVVDCDLEDPTAAFDELGFDAELLLDLVRQTGGTGKVVSDGAVLDDDMRGHRILLSGPIISHRPQGPGTPREGCRGDS